MLSFSGGKQHKGGEGKWVPDEKQPESLLQQKKRKEKKSEEVHSVGEYTGRRYTMSFRGEEMKRRGCRADVQAKNRGAAAESRAEDGSNVRAWSLMSYLNV